MILSTHGVLASSISGVDADWLAYYNRVIAAGGSLTTTEQNATKTLVADLKAYGIWSAMKAVYPMVGASAAACAQNLKSSSFTGSFTSGWTFASTGVTPNGTSAYMDSNFNPSTQFTANNNNHGSYYIRNISNSSGTFPTEMGCYAAGVAVELNFKRPNQANLGSIFMGGTTSSLLSLSLNNGFLLATNLTSFRGFNNNTKIGTATLNSTNFPNYSIVLGANRNGSTTIDPNTYSSKECAFASIGDGLTDTQASNFYTAVQAFQTTLSRQV